MAPRVDRRTVLGGALAASLPAGRVRAQAEPVRIGMITVKTGPLAASGIQFEAGLRVFLAERGNTVAGRPVELTVADSGGVPAGAKTKARELVERDRSDIVVGPLASYEALAIGDYIEASKVPFLSLAAAEDLTQRKANPWFTRVAAAAAQAPHVMGHYAATVLKLRRVAAIAEDFAFGYEQVGGFQRVFEDNGGEVVKKLWPPLNTPDYTPYLAQISNVDGVFCGIAGSNPVKFMRQFAELGFKGKVALVGGQTLADEQLLKALGDEAVGVVSAVPYSSFFASPSNQRFVADMQKAYDARPGVNAMGGYVGGLMIEAALKGTEGRVDDKEALQRAMRAFSLDESPRGPFRIDHLGNVVGNIFIIETRRDGGPLVNRIVKTYPEVSQFWTYDEAWFLAQPVYSRDYPPGRHLEP